MQKPNVPNMGSAFISHFNNSREHFEVVDENIKRLAEQVNNLNQENKTLKEEVEKLQTKRFFSMVLPIIGSITGIGALIVSIIQLLS